MTHAVDAPPLEAALATERLLESPPGAWREGALARAATIPSAGAHFDELFMIYEGAMRSAR